MRYDDPSFRIALDRYLTQEPPDDTWWFEQCAEYIEPDIDVNNKKIEKWMEYLFNKGYEPQQAAKLINLTIAKI